jgi:hypothetical protein
MNGAGIPRQLALQAAFGQTAADEEVKGKKGSGDSRIG